jgi:hypothetical protein
LILEVECLQWTCWHFVARIILQNDKSDMQNRESEEYYKNEWVTKSIIWPDENGYVFKFFKKDGIHKLYSFQKQRSIIEKKKQYIWKYLPETELIEKVDWSYYIKQKYIKWKLLKFIDIKNLDANVLSDLLDLIKGYVAYSKDEWIELDVLGYQKDIHEEDNIWKRRVLFYSRLFDSFLTSTNIMISDDNKVYMIDVCDTIPLEHPKTTIRSVKDWIRHALIDLWIKKTEHKIHRLIEEKRKELCDVLS